MKYLVVWSDRGEVIQSQVDLGICDPHQMLNNDWVELAALSEGYSDQELSELIESGYYLYLVCDMPKRFFDQ